MGNTVNRPSQSDQQWINVKDATGKITRKRNLAYKPGAKGKKSASASLRPKAARDDVNLILEDDEVIFEGLDRKRADEVIFDEPMELDRYRSATAQAFKAMVASVESPKQARNWSEAEVREKWARLTERRTEYWQSHYNQDLETVFNRGLTDSEAESEGFGAAIENEYNGLLHDSELPQSYGDVIRNQKDSAKDEFVSALDWHTLE